MLQVLFFSTILANLVGRTLPKWKAFAITTPTLLMYLSFVKLAAAPLCFIYLKSPNSWHSDIAAAGTPQLLADHRQQHCPGINSNACTPDCLLNVTLTYVARQTPVSGLSSVSLRVGYQLRQSRYRVEQCLLCGWQGHSVLPSSCYAPCACPLADTPGPSCSTRPSLAQRCSWSAELPCTMQSLLASSCGIILLEGMLQNFLMPPGSTLLQHSGLVQ